MGIKELIGAVAKLVNYSIKLMVAAALLVFFWGLVKFLYNLGQGGKPDEGKRIMKWGLISLFVMVSIWGIIGFMQRAFNLPTTASQNLPSRDTFIWPGNPPVPGNLPSRDTYIWPTNSPKSGNLPVSGNAPVFGNFSGMNSPTSGKGTSECRFRFLGICWRR